MCGGIMELVLGEMPNFNEYENKSRTHWSKASRIKRNYTLYVKSEAKKQLKPMDKIRKITFIWKHPNKRRDFDNVEAGQKFIRDGLVSAGIVANDGWKHFPPRTLHKHEVNKDDPGVIVIIK